LTGTPAPQLKEDVGAPSELRQHIAHPAADESQNQGAEQQRRP